MTFPYGVASGDPTCDSVVLWAKVDDFEGSAEVCWSVADADGNVHSRGIAKPEPGSDGTIRVCAGGLDTDTRYSYAFESKGDLSPRGTFRTLPAGGVPVKFAVVCCAKYNAGFFSAYRHIANRDDLHFVLHLGDYIYEAANKPPASQTASAGIGREFEPTWECRTLADYRSRYAQYRTDPDLLALHASHALIATIDDHEIADNAWSGGAEEHDDARDGPWSERQAAALRAWHEWLPVRPGTGTRPIWRSVDLGDLGSLALLETRTSRMPPWVTEASPTLLGRDQEEWLDELAASSQGWIVVCSPSTVAPIWNPGLSERSQDALRTLKLIDPATDGPFHDLWDSYPADRAHLLRLEDQAGGRLFVISGDVHISTDIALPHGDAQSTLREWTAPSVTSQNLDCKKHWAPRTNSLEYESAFERDAPYVTWCDFDSHGYLVVTLDSSRATGEWWLAHQVTRPGTTLELAHTSEIAIGRRP